MTGSIFDTIKATRNGHFQAEYGAEGKYAAAVAAHDAAWFSHKGRCAAERVRYLQSKGVTADAKLLEKELKLLEKNIAKSAYHNNGWLNARKLELSQYQLVTEVLTYHTLSQLAK